MFACIHVPDFPVQAALRGESIDFRERPAAVLEGPDSLVRVFALNEAARRFGIETGMTRLQAEVCPGIVLRRRSVTQEESAQAALLDCASGFSPLVESTLPGVAVASLSGGRRLLGPLQKIGRDLMDRAQVCGFFVSAGIAANPDSALFAARGFKGLSILPPGKEAALLAKLPIEILQPEPGMLEVLESWGTRNFGALAALPEIPLVERLGQAGLTLQRLARGAVRRELVPAEPPSSFTETLELEEPVTLLEPLAFVLNRLLKQVTARLRARSLATDLIRVALELEIHPDRQLQSEVKGSHRPPRQSRDDGTGDPGEACRRELKLPLPTQEHGLLLKLMQLDLAAQPPSAPVKRVTITAEPARVRYTQSGLFLPLVPEPGRLETALARLRALAGGEDSQGRLRVGSPMVSDSHRPDCFEVVPLRSAVGSKTRLCSQPTQLALRIFRPPLAARVEIHGKVPAAAAFQGKRARVVAASGPWRSSGQWWTLNRWQREEWDLELSGNTVSGLYRLFWDRGLGQWFVEGMYD